MAYTLRHVLQARRDVLMPPPWLAATELIAGFQVGASGSRCSLVLGKIGRSAARLRCFSLCCTRKAFNPFLVIAVERTGILTPEFLEKVGALLRLLG